MAKTQAGSSRFDSLFFENAPCVVPDTYAKRTLLHSPVVMGMYLQFRYSSTKPLMGLASLSLNDENDQFLHTPEQDSYFGDDMSEEDDAMWRLNHDDSVPASQDSLQLSSSESSTATAELMVRVTSLLVNGVSYSLPAAVTACVVVPGSTEDSLLISLSSGFSLLIRLWKVPRGLEDPSLATAFSDTVATTTSHVVRPFVVQWWKLSSQENFSVQCSALAAHPQGLAVVSCAPDSHIRIHICEQTTVGLQLSPHFNVPVNGAILHSCFAHPFDSLGPYSHLMFMVLTFSNNRRLEISLYSWYMSDSLNGNIERSTLPLNGTFPFPVLAIPLSKNSSFLFVCPGEFIIVTIHNILSADYSFSKFAYDGSFPTSYFLPRAPLLSSESSATDEILLASDSGIIYSVIIKENKELTYVPVIKLPDSIATFSLSHNSSGSGYNLTFSRDTGGSRELYIPSLLPKQSLSIPERKLPYSDATIIKNYKGWALIVDVLVIDSFQTRSTVNEVSQELWVLHGMEKRTKLSHLSTGYLLKRDSSIFEEFRKGMKLFFLKSESSEHLLCSMPFKTRFLKYLPDTDEDSELEDDEVARAEPFVEIEEPALVSDSPTLCCNYLPDSDVLFQFTSRSICISNVSNCKTSFFYDREILFADMVGHFAVLAVEEHSNVSIEIVRLSSMDGFDSEENILSNRAYFNVLFSSTYEQHISMLNCFLVDEYLYIFVGSFESEIDLLKFNINNHESEKIFSFSLLSICAKNTNDNDYDDIIPHDCAYLQTLRKLFIGSKSGHVVEFHVNDAGSFIFSRILVLGIMPVCLFSSKTDENFLFVCLQNLWLFNFYCSDMPVKVTFNEKIPKSIITMTELPTDEEQHLRFAFLREDGLTIGSIFCHDSVLLKHINIGEPAKKVIYFDSLNIFVLLCKSKDSLTRLKFADRKSYKMLSTVEIDSRTSSPRSDPIFLQTEIPICGMVWTVVRHGRLSKKLIVGTSAEGRGGSLKILDISKVSLQKSSSHVVKVAELISIQRDSPVKSVQQIGSTIFFSAGCVLYSTSYNLESKRFSPIREEYTGESDIVGISVVDNVLLVNKRMDSLSAFCYSEDGGSGYDSSEEYPSKLSVLFHDSKPRSMVNVAGIGDKYVGGDQFNSSILMLDLKSVKPCFVFKVPMIPRVYSTNFKSYWDDLETKPLQMLCVGVNGEIIGIELLNSAEEIMQIFRDTLALTYGLSDNEALAKFVERLERPFTEKVTGKGLHTIYKPYFSFHENRAKAIDFDILELSKLNKSSFRL